jgi:GMP synthase (glutamine-hydrolysing)
VRTGLIIENQANAPPGLLGRWLEARRVPLATHRTWESGVERLPDPEEHRFVIVLGSAESATNDDPRWIPGIREYVRRATDRDVPVLGICLGAQILSQALGGSVSAMPEPEIYWGDVHTCEAAVPEGPWLVWHYDAFTVPPGATELARSERAPLAFRRGSHLGIQFHAETTPEIAATWAEEERQEFEQWGLDPVALAREGERVREQAAEAADRLFDYWWVNLASRRG